MPITAALSSLKLANSPWLDMSRRIGNVTDAFSILGFKRSEHILTEIALRRRQAAPRLPAGEPAHRTRADRPVPHLRTHHPALPGLNMHAE